MIESNSTYTHVRLSSGRETTVSVRDTAPRVESNTALPENSRKTIFIDSDVSVDTVGDRNASSRNAATEQGISGLQN